MIQFSQHLSRYDTNISVQHFTSHNYYFTMIFKYPCLQLLLCVTAVTAFIPTLNNLHGPKPICFMTNDEGKGKGDLSTDVPIENTTASPTTSSSGNSATNANKPPPIPRPTPELMMRALNTSPRRIFLSTLASSGIALTSNFFGVTSNILSAIPETTVEKTGLDLLYPRGDMKRFKSGEFQYTFVVPKEWVQDTAVELAKIQSRAAALDYNMKKSNNGSIPDAAFGPPGKFTEKGISNSDTNISTLVSKVRPGFTLRSLGSPTEAAEKLLRVSLAPEGSGKVATLLAACEEVRGESNLYQFEYRVDRGDKGLPLRAISIIAVRDGDALITMTVVSLEQAWENEAFEAKLRTVAQSFKLTR